jgi:hypothetical protein
MRGGYLGIAAGILLLILLPPLAVFVGGLSAGFHRGTAPETFGLGLSWACRWAFYGVAALTVAGVLVLALLIDAQMGLFILAMIGVLAAAIGIRQGAFSQRSDTK